MKPEEVAAKKGMLKSSERDEFEDMLRGASMDRDSVKAVMGFCLDHCDAAEEVGRWHFCLLVSPILFFLLLVSSDY